MAVDTSVYASRVDLTNRNTMVTTLTAVATQARVDAAQLEEEARDLKVQAGNLSDKERLGGAADDLLREAARRNEDADSRRGLAAAYEAKAAAV